MGWGVPEEVIRRFTAQVGLSLSLVTRRRMEGNAKIILKGKGGKGCKAKGRE